jgi:hypothetical protein
MGHVERLHDATDVLAYSRCQQQMKVVRHQTIGIQLEEISGLRLGLGLKKEQVICWRAENGGTIIATVQEVVEKTISDRSRQTRHTGTLRPVP